MTTTRNRYVLDGAVRDVVDAPPVATLGGEDVRLRNVECAGQPAASP